VALALLCHKSQRNRSRRLSDRIMWDRPGSADGEPGRRQRRV